MQSMTFWVMTSCNLISQHQSLRHTLYTYSQLKTLFLTCDKFLFIIRLNLNALLFKHKAIPVSRSQSIWVSTVSPYFILLIVFMPGVRILLQALFNCHQKNLSLLRIYKIAPALRGAGIVSELSIFIRGCVMRWSQWPRGLKVWVCVRSLAGIAGSYSDEVMAVCLLRLLCVVT